MRSAPTDRVLVADSDVEMKTAAPSKKKKALSASATAEKRSAHLATQGGAPYDSLDRQKAGLTMSIIEGMQVRPLFLFLSFPFIYLSLFYRLPAAALIARWSFRRPPLVRASANSTGGACPVRAAVLMAAPGVLSPSPFLDWLIPSPLCKGGARSNPIVSL